MANKGELEKLTISAYTEADLAESSLVGSFVTQVNPEKVSLKYEIESPEDQAQGTSGQSVQFGFLKPQEFSFEFMFDSTGAIPAANGQGSDTSDVFDRVKDFLALVYDYNGEQHRPNYLKIVWGRVLFKCVLKTVNVDYRLFKADGTPLRAVANATFSGSVEEKERVAIEGSESPDITHSRRVKDGETLHQLTYEIYGDPKYYLEVAKANNLTNFRKLKTGQILYFPPIEKNVS